MAIETKTVAATVAEKALITTRTQLLPEKRVDKSNKNSNDSKNS